MEACLAAVRAFGNNIRVIGCSADGRNDADSRFLLVPEGGLKGAIVKGCIATNIAKFASFEGGDSVLVAIDGNQHISNNASGGHFFYASNASLREAVISGNQHLSNGAAPSVRALTSAVVQATIDDNEFSGAINVSTNASSVIRSRGPLSNRAITGASDIWNAIRPPFSKDVYGEPND